MLTCIFYVFASLAVHPDKITIATGQVAGTSSDGKVSVVFLYILIITVLKRYGATLKKKDILKVS